MSDSGEMAGVEETEAKQLRTKAVVEQGVALMMTGSHEQTRSAHEVRQRLCAALAAGRAIIVSARQDELDLCGLALWASVSDGTDARLRGDEAPHAAALAPSEWNGGDIIWLLEVAAPISDARMGVMQAFRHVAGDRPFSIHPAARRAIGPELLKQLKQTGVNSAIAKTGTDSDALAPPRPGPPVRIETERFLLVSLDESEAATIGAWMSDSRVTSGLLQTPRVVGVEQARAFISKFDDLLSYLIGIRTLDGDVLIGYYMVQIDPHHRTASISIVIGEPTALRQQTGIETARALVGWLFEVRGLEKITVEVAETNLVVIAWMSSRLRLEGRLIGEIRKLDGSRLDLLRFGLLRDEWADVRAASVARGTQSQV